MIAFSSYDDDAIRRRCVEAGFDAYLSKPAPRERIHDILRAIAEGRALPEQALPQGQRPGGPEDPVDVDPDMLGALPRFVETRSALIEDLRGVSESNEIATIKEKSDALQNAFNALSQQLYAQEGGQSGAAPGGAPGEGFPNYGGANGNENGNGPTPDSDDEGEVVEGEFTEA